ncbi:hypothetical protein Hsar01_04127 [Haloferula sargassicola]|uniref:Uncharacterized protein n=1 Tax=Haloferula sargassicola TaxID=490096 RepID=A0ABP9UTM1_9BACT
MSRGSEPAELWLMPELTNELSKAPRSGASESESALAKLSLSRSSLT